MVLRLSVSYVYESHCLLVTLLSVTEQLVCYIPTLELNNLAITTLTSYTVDKLQYTIYYSFYLLDREE